MAHELVVKEWVYKADQDFGFASQSLKRESDYFDQICFFFHQAAEKYLKAYIVKFDLKFEKIHDLVRLLEICKAKDTAFTQLQKACEILTPFYFETRYPDLVFAIRTRGETEEALQAAVKIQEFIKGKLMIKGRVRVTDLKKEHKKIDKSLKSGG